MTNEEKAARLEEMQEIVKRQWDLSQAYADAALLLESAAMWRERDNRSLLTGPDWKGMYEAQERDSAALRQEQEGLREKAELLDWAAEQESTIYYCYAEDGDENNYWSVGQHEAADLLSALPAGRGAK
jgi:hypothetical protein